MNELANRHSNEPPIFDRLAIRADELVLNANNAPAKIEDQPTADKYKGFLQQLHELGKEADSERLKEKRPHLDAEAAIDRQWNERVLEPARRVYAVLKKKLTEWEIFQDQERRRQADEARRKAEEAQREAEEKQRQAEEAAKAQTGTAAQALRADAEALEATRAAEAAEKTARAAERAKSTTGNQYAGASGRARAVALTTIRTAKIVDMRLATLFFLGEPDLQEVVQKLANRAVGKKETVPGVEVIETKDVRL